MTWYPKRPTAALAAIALACLALSSAAHATLLVDNPFDLALSDGANLNGVAVNATGFTGNYSTNNRNQDGTVATDYASDTYTTTGLSFGSNFHPVSGGAAVISAARAPNGTPKPGTRTARLIATIDAAATGTVYSSYLTYFDPAGTDFHSYDGTGTTLTAGSLTTSTNVHSPYSGGDRLGVGVGSSLGTANFTPYTGTTYLVLSKYTNIATASSVSENTLWLLTLSGYDAWFTAGADEAELATYAVKTVSNTSPAGTYNLYGTFANVVESGQYRIKQTIDEFRIGTTLADVTNVPEPASLALLGIGVTLIAARRRRDA